MTTIPNPPVGAEPEHIHPNRIGPYRLERVLGTGGMGTVSLGVRDDDHFRKRVALKLMRAELRGAELRGRFRGERQILALLNHPNIAALIDGGETESGQLYEVMEYVSGSPIDAYCREHQLGVRARLRLFLDVCAAVSHAHRYLVVHRDIKPDNVFVTTEGAVKLLDFGIAKILRPELFDLPGSETRAAFSPCTPLYASPEQVRNQPVSTASDVYALGVLLFELLTGTVPYNGSNHTETSLARAICDDEPLVPSAAVENEAERKELTGDLDNIILMALRKEPHDRYASVDQFASDIRRHLEGFPVRARKSSARYRLSKFVRRNSVPVAAAATIVIVLSAAGFATYRMAHEAKRERDTARAVAQFMASIFEQNDPAQSKGKNLTAKEALERGVERIDTELAGRPEVQGILKHIAGKTLRHMGDLNRGRALLEESLDLRRRTAGPRHRDVAETLVELGRANVVSTRYAVGGKQLEEAVDLYRKAAGDRSAETAGAKTYLGLAYYYLWKLRESRAVLEDSMRTLEGLGLTIDDELYRQTLHTLTLVWKEEGSGDLAEAGLRKLLEADRKQLGEHPDVVLSLAGLGYFLVKNSKPAQAEPLLREALAMHQRVLPDGAVSLGHVMQYLALCLQELGQFDEAEKLWKELIPIHVKYLGQENNFVAADWVSYGEFERKRGNLTEAERLSRKGLDMRLRLFGPDHLLIAHARSLHGRIWRDRKDYPRAIHEFREALRIRRQKMPSDRKSIRTVLRDLANALDSAGDKEAARPFHEEAESIGGDRSPVMQAAARTVSR